MASVNRRSGDSSPSMPPKAPPEVFKDVHNLLERSLHLSFFDQGDSYEARTLHLKRFMSLGLAMLPEKETVFHKEMTEYMDEHLDAPKAETRPAGDEVPLYEIQTNLRGGSSVEIYREHLEFAVHSVREAFYEGQYNDLMIWADKLAMLLVKHKMLTYEDVYQGRKSEKWGGHVLPSRASVIRRGDFEDEPEND